MKSDDILERCSQTIKMAESRVYDYKAFAEKYNLKDKEYFIEKLNDMEYSKNEMLSILVNKDLLLTLFFNSFDVSMTNDSMATHIDLEVEKAKKEYIDAVDIANQTIELANEAQNIMLSLKNVIESEYGCDSNLWQEDSVHEMNEAIKIYNDLVEKANKDIKISNIAKEKVIKTKSSNNLNGNNIVLETN